MEVRKIMITILYVFVIAVTCAAVVSGKVVVIPADCEYDIITGESEMITKVRSMLE